MKELYEKHRELILYAVFGAGTAAVDVFLYSFTVNILGIRTANAVGWCGAVLFAFFTNKYFVFQTGHRGSHTFWREFAEFIGARLLSLGIEVIGVDALVRCGFDRPLLGVTGGAAKILVTIIVILVNYLFSKFLIFRTGGARA